MSEPSTARVPSTPAGKKQKTQVVQDNLDPEWNETFTWSLSVALAPSDQLQVDVYDHEKIGRKRQALVHYIDVGSYSYRRCNDIFPPSLLASALARISL